MIRYLMKIWFEYSWRRNEWEVSTREPDTINIIDLITELHKTNENISKRDYDFTDENEDQAQKISFQLSIDKKKLFEAFFTIKEALITLNIPRYNEICNLVFKTIEKIKLFIIIKINSKTWKSIFWCLEIAKQEVSV